jgi:hypothetical protein
MPKLSSDAVHEAPEVSRIELFDPPVPLDDSTPYPFPVKALPPWQREYVSALAYATQTPPDIAALLVLAGTATAVQKKVRVHIRQGYSEPLNVFVAVVMPPGSRKSPVFEEVMRPIQAYEEALMRERAEEIARAETAYNIAKAELQHLQAKAAREEGVERMRLDEEAATLAVKLLGMVPPEKPRLVTDDTTPERLASLLAANQGRMAVLSAEGDVFGAMAGRYTAHQGRQGASASHFAVFLKGYSGDTLHVDRVGRPAEYIRQPSLTLGLAIQPGVLQGLQRHPEFRERGLLGRFFYGIPPVLLGRRQTRTVPVPDAIRATYYSRLTALLKLPLAIDDEGFPVSHALQLTPEARAIFEDFEARVEPMLAPFGSLGHMTDWSGKLAGSVARIMGLLHCARTTQDPWLTRIAPETAQYALEIGQYLIAHARVAYGSMGADAALEDAKHLLAWLKREPRETITKRDLHQATKARFSRISLMEPSLEILIEHGFLIPQAPATQEGKPGRPAGPSYDVNPHLYSRESSAQNTHNTQNRHDEEGFEDYEYFEPEKEVATEEVGATIAPPSVNGTHDHTGTVPCIHERFVSSPLAEKQPDGSILLRCPDCLLPLRIQPAWGSNSVHGKE